MKIVSKFVLSLSTIFHCKTLDQLLLNINIVIFWSRLLFLSSDKYAKTTEMPQIWLNVKKESFVSITVNYYITLCTAN
jgi:hypothetical protein